MEQIKDNQNRITHDEQQIIQYIESAAADKEESQTEFIYYVELHEQHTERLLCRSEGMSRDEAERAESLLDKIVGDDVYVYISVERRDAK